LHYRKIKDKCNKEGAHYFVVTVEFGKDFWWATVTGAMYMAHYQKKFGMRLCISLQSSVD
jgi:hypothetical protein